MATILSRTRYFKRHVPYEQDIDWQTDMNLSAVVFLLIFVPYLAHITEIHHKVYYFFQSVEYLINDRQHMLCIKTLTPRQVVWYFANNALQYS